MSYLVLQKLFRFFLLSVALTANCHAQEAKGVEQRFGVLVPHAGQRASAHFAWRNFPVTRLYPDFTEEEKSIFHAWYEEIAPGDEPPYPTINMAAISHRFAEYMRRYPISGKVELLVKVGADGEVKSFSILGTSSPEVAEFNMLMLRQVRFKPAKCGGKPCEMDFPWFFRMERNTM